jgi:CheY-like chemotaxis protein
MMNLLIKILIVDDDRVDRGLCKRCLQDSAVWSFECAEANSAQAGILNGEVVASRLYAVGL